MFLGKLGDWAYEMLSGHAIADQRIVDFIDMAEWVSLWLVITVTLISIFGLVAIYAERKVSAHMQSRLGPMRVGPKGLLQTLADGVKLLEKEDIIPKAADPILFIAAPCFVFASAVAMFAVLPFANYEGTTTETISELHATDLSFIDVNEPYTNMTELERRKEKKRRQNFAAVVNAFEEGALVEAVHTALPQLSRNALPPSLVSNEARGSSISNSVTTSENSNALEAGAGALNESEIDTEPHRPWLGSVSTFLSGGWTPLRVPTNDPEAAIRKLAIFGIDSRWDTDESAVSVENRFERFAARILSCSKLLPNGATAYGFIKESAIPSEDKARQDRFRVELQNELASLIKMMPDVSDAIVNFKLASGSREFRFGSDYDEAQAHVMLVLENDRAINPAQCLAIVKLVSGATETLQPSNVSLMDTSARVYLYDGTWTKDPAAKDSAFAEPSSSTENELLAELPSDRTGNGENSRSGGLGERTGFESNYDVLLQYYAGHDEALGTPLHARAFKHTVEQELSNTKAKVFLDRPWFGTPAYVGAGLFFILAISSISTMGVVLAGWGSNNKWALYGAIREAAQMVSYEIPMGIAALCVVVANSSLNLMDIAQVQETGTIFGLAEGTHLGFLSWNIIKYPVLLPVSIIFFVSVLAHTKRAPFDLPEAESELIAGFMTEYSGMRWSLFFLAEYGEMYALAALTSVLFFGGFSMVPILDGVIKDIGPMAWLAYGAVVLLAKSLFLVFVMMWLRWTLPRIRLDQIMYMCLKCLLPFTMVALLLQTLWTLNPIYGVVGVVVALVVMMALAKSGSQNQQSAPALA